jgi:hypothetical protein
LNTSRDLSSPSGVLPVRATLVVFPFQNSMQLVLQRQVAPRD